MEGKNQEFDKEFLISHYSYLSEEIRFSKRQQMMATWYVLLLFGAIVKTHKSWWPEAQWIAIIASLILLIIGLAFICRCKRSNKNNNGRIAKVREEFCLSEDMTENTYAVPCCPIENLLWSIEIDCLFYLIHIFACIITIFIIIN